MKKGKDVWSEEVCRIVCSMIILCDKKTKLQNLSKTLPIFRRQFLRFVIVYQCESFQQTHLMFAWTGRGGGGSVDILCLVSVGVIYCLWYLTDDLFCLYPLFSVNLWVFHVRCSLVPGRARVRSSLRLQWSYSRYNYKMLAELVTNNKFYLNVSALVINSGCNKVTITG